MANEDVADRIVLGAQEHSEDVRRRGREGAASTALSNERIESGVAVHFRQDQRRRRGRREQALHVDVELLEHDAPRFERARDLGVHEQRKCQMRHRDGTMTSLLRVERRNAENGEQVPAGHEPYPAEAPKHESQRRERSSAGADQLEPRVHESNVRDCSGASHPARRTTA